jgi:hypothetical protein
MLSMYEHWNFRRLDAMCCCILTRSFIYSAVYWIYALYTRGDSHILQNSAPQPVISDVCRRCQSHI